METEEKLKQYLQKKTVKHILPVTAKPRLSGSERVHALHILSDKAEPL